MNGLVSLTCAVVDIITRNMIGIAVRECRAPCVCRVELAAQIPKW